MKIPKNLLLAVLLLIGYAGTSRPAAGGETHLPEGAFLCLSVRSAEAVLQAVDDVVVAATKGSDREIPPGAWKTLIQLYPFVPALKLEGWEKDQPIFALMTGSRFDPRNTAFLITVPDFDAFAEEAAERSKQPAIPDEENDCVRIPIPQIGLCLAAPLGGGQAVLALTPDSLAAVRGYWAEGWRPRHWSDGVIAAECAPGLDYEQNRISRIAAEFGLEGAAIRSRVVLSPEPGGSLDGIGEKLLGVLAMYAIGTYPEAVAAIGEGLDDAEEGATGLTFHPDRMDGVLLLWAEAGKDMADAVYAPVEPGFVQRQIPESFDASVPGFRRSGSPAALAFEEADGDQIAELSIPLDSLNAAYGNWRLFKRHLRNALQAEADKPNPDAGGEINLDDLAIPGDSGGFGNDDEFAMSTGGVSTGVTTLDDPSVALCPFLFGGKWGYIDPSGRVAIPFRFSAARDFSWGGLAAVGEEGKWGFIDAQGDVVIPCEYDAVGDFAANGLAPARKGDDWGYINGRNETVLSFEYDRAGNFDGNGIARVLVRQGTDGNRNEDYYISAKGQKFATFHTPDATNDLIDAVDADRRYGFIDRTGEIIIPFRFSRVYPFNEKGLARACVGGEKITGIGGKWGCINKKGEEVIPLIYDDLSYGAFEESDFAKVKKDGLVGYINIRGKEIVPVQFEDAELDDDSATVRVKRGGKWGVETLDGEVVVPCRYESLGAFGEHGVAVMERDGKYGLLNRDYQESVPPTYSSIGKVSPEGLMTASLDGKTGIIDTTGAIRLDFIFDAIKEVPADGLLPARKNDKWGFATLDGETAVPFEYDEIQRDGFSANGLAAVRRDDKWGYVNRDGEEIIPCKYFEAEEFGRTRRGRTRNPSDFDASGYAQVKLTRFTCGYINTDGGIVIPLRFNNLGSIDEFGWIYFSYYPGDRRPTINGFIHATNGWMIGQASGIREARDLAKSGLIRVKKDGKYGFVDRQGVVVLPLRFDAATDFSRSGLAMVRENGLVRCIDPKGVAVVEEAPEGNGTVLKNRDGNIVWPMD